MAWFGQKRPVCHRSYSNGGPTNHSFGLALAVSLALHALVLCIKLTSPVSAVRLQMNPGDSRLDVTLSKQGIPATAIPLPPHPLASPKEHRPKILTARPNNRTAAATDSSPSWTVAEKDEMDQFLNGLAAQSKPRTGRELAQRALAMARTMAVPEQPDDEMKEMVQKFVNARVEPFSIEMYFDALFRKMNRSATMIPNEQRTKGRHVAAVRVVVNQDGSVKSFRVLWAADQQMEIAYIKAVVDLAAPFPVFPQDIRNATDSIVLQICIVPNSDGGGGGATFTRMSQGQSCQAR